MTGGNHHHSQRQRRRRRPTRPAGQATVLAERAKLPPLIEESAGGVVFKQAPRGLQIAFIKDPYGRWTFAKGHVEEGESLKEAAVRETQEEMGIRSLRVIAKLGSIELRFVERYDPEKKGRNIHKHVHYFLMQAAPGAFGNTRGDRKIQGMTWVPLDQALTKSSYEDAVPILRRALRILKRQEQVQRPRPQTSPTAK